MSCDSQSSEKISFDGIGNIHIEEILVQSKRLNRFPLIYFTSIACVNCRNMEKAIMKDIEVKKAIRNDFMLIPLVVDDRKIAEKDFWKKSLFSNKLLKRVGEINSELQIELTQSGWQPVFAILNKEGEVISQTGYSKNLDEFMTFLNDGKKAVKSSPYLRQ